MAKSSNKPKSARRSNRSNSSPAYAIDWGLVASAFARSSAALLRESADQLEALASSTSGDHVALVRDIHRILAGDVATAFVASQEIQAAVSRSIG